jgi:hypothetical protein
MIGVIVEEADAGKVDGAAMEDATEETVVIVDAGKEEVGGMDGAVVPIVVDVVIEGGVVEVEQVVAEEADVEERGDWSIRPMIMHSHHFREREVCSGF